ncbi:MAG TPA: O-antigen ligase family protein [Chloroflexota bacterium]
MGLLPSADLTVSLQKLAVMVLAGAIVLLVPRLSERARVALAWVVVASAVIASAVGNVLVDRNSWKLDALNRAVYGAFGHIPRFSEVAFSQNGLAAAVILAIPFGGALAIRGGWRIAAGVATAALVGELLVTESRAAMLSLGLALGLLAVYTTRRWLGLALSGGAVALLASGLVALPLQLSWLPTGGSSAERLAIWQSSLLMIADTPFTGIGMGMFQRVYPLYILPAYHNIHPHAHNLFLQTYLDAGPLGCAGMLVLAGAAVAAMVRLARHPRPEPLAVAAAISSAAVLLHAQVDSYFAGDPRTYFVMLVPIGLLLGASPPRRWRWRWRPVAAGLACLGLTIAVGTPLVWVNAGSAERLKAALSGDPAYEGRAEAAFERALRWGPVWQAERGLGLLAAARGDEAEAVARLKAAEAAGAPGALVHFERGQGLYQGGQLEAAVGEWRQSGAGPYLARVGRQAGDEGLLVAALRVEPDNEEARTVLAELYLGGGQRDRAVEVLRAGPAARGADERALLAVVEGASVSGFGALELGRAYRAVGNWAMAEASFQELARTDPIGEYELGELEVARGHRSEALVSLEAAVEAIPNQEEFRLGLARAYVAASLTARAQEEYRAVLGLDPGNLEARGALR